MNLYYIEYRLNNAIFKFEAYIVCKDIADIKRVLKKAKNFINIEPIIMETSLVEENVLIDG